MAMPMPVPSRPLYVVLVEPVRTPVVVAPVMVSSVLAVRWVWRLGATNFTSLRAATLLTRLAGNVAVSMRRLGKLASTLPPARLISSSRPLIEGSWSPLTNTACTMRRPLCSRAQRLLGVAPASIEACRSFATL